MKLENEKATKSTPTSVIPTSKPRSERCRVFTKKIPSLSHDLKMFHLVIHEFKIESGARY
jgi:hypothetical protein